MPCMDFSPFQEKSLNITVREIVKSVRNRIAPLPDEVFLPLVSSALLWVDLKIDDVIRLQSEVVEFDKKYQQKSVPWRQRHCRKLISSFRFSKIPGTKEPWHETILPITIIEKHNEAAIGIWGRHVVRRLIIAAKGACYIVLQYLAGLRPGEMCDLVAGWNYRENLPNCVELRYSKDGLLKMFYLKGVLSKAQLTPTEEVWLIGVAPVGSEVFPATVRALVLLEKIDRPWRELKVSDALSVAFSGNQGLPSQPSSVAAFGTKQLLRHTRNFILNEVDFSKLPDFSKRGEDLRTFRELRGLNIITYHGRKTFAAYILETRATLLRAVSEHFKHMGIAATEEGYFSKNTRLRQDTDSVARTATIEFFSAVSGGAPMYGSIALLVDKYFSESGFYDLSLREREEMVVEDVDKHNLRIFPSKYGDCLIQLRPLQSKCQKAVGQESWASMFPNQATRSPVMCGSCGCFAINPMHLPFWKEREHNFHLVLKENSIAGFSREFSVVEERLKQARKIISFIEKSMKSDEDD